MQGLLKSTIGLTAISFLLLHSINASYAQATRWVRVITMRLPAEKTQGIYYVDGSSIKTIRNFRYYWISLVYTNPVQVNEGGRKFSVGQILAYTSINCNDKNDYQIHRIEVLNQSNKKITSLNFDRENTSFLPTEGTRMTGNYVCSRK